MYSEPQTDEKVNEVSTPSELLPSWDDFDVIYSLYKNQVKPDMEQIWQQDKIPFEIFTARFIAADADDKYLF